MAIFNDTVPANTEAVKLGAGRIREMKTSLNTMLGQIFDDALAFLPGWVTSALIQNHASDNAQRAIGPNHIQNNAVILRTLPDDVFTADADGRAKFADGFVNGALLDPALQLPDGIVDEDALALLAVATGNIQNLAVTLAKVGAGVAKIAIGTYAGSDSAVATISGLAFAPDFIIVVSGNTHHSFAIAFRQESVANVGPLHTIGTGLDDSINSPYTTAVTWTSDGFVINPDNFPYNNNGRTHSYVAVKL